ncbi:MAG: hypothetical protein ACXW2T_08160 [Allosphingosinicella sp.]
MSDRDNQVGAGLADDEEALRAQPSAGSGTAQSDDEQSAGGGATANATFAPGPGDPGGMGGVRVQGGNPQHRPPGGSSPIPMDVSSDES